MKKILLFIIVFLSFYKTPKASETFYLGDHVPDIYIYMDRINKRVYRQFRMIYRTSTDELVYCIEPGATLSSNNYDSYEEFNSIFNLTEEKFNRIKLIAYYGYNYKNHTDIKWYAITQYIIWKEIMPSSWEMYFVDENHNRQDSWYQEEINEIYTLVNNHDENAGIKDGYVINYKRNIVIDGTDELQNYKSNNGYINGNKLVIDNLNYGKNDILLSYSNYNAPIFYYNAGGQNILKKGDVLKNKISTYVYVSAGKFRVNECNEEDFSNTFIGGTYEVINEDDVTLDEFTCNNQECISNYLPVGFYRIRVKNLPDNFEKNKYIYDIEIKDNETSNITICSLPKKEVRRNINDESKEEITTDETINEEPYEYENIDIIDNGNVEEISIPHTSKYSIFKILLAIIIPLLYLFINIRNENNN